MATRQIVGKFNKELSRIEFYEIMDNYKEYTIIRKQGTNSYYAWNNKKKLFSNKLCLGSIPQDKTKYENVIKLIDVWFNKVVFFWATSKFVTEYGLPHYDRLIALYKELIDIKLNDIKLQETLENIRKNEGFLTYLRCRITSYRFITAQRGTIRRLEKEFELIW